GKGGPLQLQGVLDAAAVERVFEASGHEWRDRLLGPAETVELFIRQVMEGNISCSQVRHLAGGAFTSGGYCQARSRLPVAALWALCRLAGEQLRSGHRERGRGRGGGADDGGEAGPCGLWLGRHRTVLLAGARF